MPICYFNLAFLLLQIPIGSVEGSQLSVSHFWKTADMFKRDIPKSVISNSDDIVINSGYIQMTKVCISNEHFGDVYSKTTKISCQY